MTSWHDLEYLLFVLFVCLCESVVRGEQKRTTLSVLGSVASQSLFAVCRRLPFSDQTTSKRSRLYDTPLVSIFSFYRLNLFYKLMSSLAIRQTATMARHRAVALRQPQRRTFLDWMTNYPDKVRRRDRWNFDFLGFSVWFMFLKLLKTILDQWAEKASSRRRTGDPHVGQTAQR